MFFHFPHYAAEYTSYVAASRAVVFVSHAGPLTGWVKAGRKDWESRQHAWEIYLGVSVILSEI